MQSCNSKYLPFFLVTAQNPQSELPKAKISETSNSKEPKAKILNLRTWQLKSQIELPKVKIPKTESPKAKISNSENPKPKSENKQPESQKFPKSKI